MQSGSMGDEGNGYSDQVKFKSDVLEFGCHHLKKGTYGGKLTQGL